MGLIGSIRRLRHGRLSGLDPLWRALGRVHRALVKAVGSSPSSHFIGPYGPFLMMPRFAFSAFENWGTGHNAAFETCIEACRDVRCVIDVGAHIGLVSLPASRVVAPSGTVYAFEPAAANLEYLREHVRLNAADNIEIIDALMGPVDADKVTFYERDIPTGQNSVVVKRDHDEYRQTARSQVTLDSFCSQRGLEPDVIKIDVEGAELGVLRGGMRTLQRSRPKIFLSVHPRELELLGHHVREVAEVLDTLDYAAHDATGLPIAEFLFSEYVLLPRDSE